MYPVRAAGHGDIHPIIHRKGAASSLQSLSQLIRQANHFHTAYVFLPKLDHGGPAHSGCTNRIL